MAKEENMVILKMLQEGTITADQASELLSAVDKSEKADASADGQETPAAETPTPSTSVPLPPNLPPHLIPEADSEAFARARARIAAARERVAGFQEKLSAAEQKIEHAKDSPNPWEQVTDALKDVPGARSVADAMRGIDPGRIASTARRQARRMARSVRSQIGDLDFNLNLNFSEAVQGEPNYTVPREASAIVPNGGTLRIRNTLGSIEAQGADVPEARVAGVLKVWAETAEAATAIAEQITLVVEEGSDGPTIRVHHPDKQRRVSLDLKVFVPEAGARLSLLSLSGDVTARGLKGNAAVVLATQSGDAKASELAGDVAVETASGDIVLEGIAGNVTAASASGAISAIRVLGQNFRGTTQSGDVELTESNISIVHIETVSGDAKLKGVSGRSLRVRAVSGDARADGTAFDDETHLDTVSGYLFVAPRGPLSAGSVGLVTVSGDADLTLPGETNALLEIAAKSGDIEARFLGSDNAEKTIKGSATRIVEQIGKGAGAKLSVSTISGDLTITQNSSVIEMT